MSRNVTLPPSNELLPDGTKVGGWWRESADHDGRLVCELCPRLCSLKEGDRGFCFVRQNRGGQIVLTTYGRSTGFCVDPIEKKPLNHFYPGTPVLSFGTAGCNLGCKFCQNWSISKSREVERLSDTASGEMIAQAALERGCRSVAFTYNDPVIWAEYAIDVARACHAVGVKTVAVTAGYITPAARGPFYEVMDAANVDLKAFSEEFYFKLTLSHLEPVLDTLRWLKRETDVWFEITNLVIPRANDTPDEFRRMCAWILDNLGDEVPVHFTAFHPDFRMTDRPRTPVETLLAAYDVARQAGIKYAYVGNVDDLRHQSTYCPGCGRVVIERNWYELGAYAIRGGACSHCGQRIAGHFDDAPGTWGRRRLPVRISQFAPPDDSPPQSPPQSPPHSPPQSPPQSPPHSPPTVAISEVTTMSSSQPEDPVEKATAAPSPPADPPTITAGQQTAIHAAASGMVAAAVARRADERTNDALGEVAGQTLMGAFVTLKRNGRLRSCCGFLGTTVSLGDAVSHAARRTALEDLRFPPISVTELEHLHLEVSLLHAPRRIEGPGEDRAAAVVVGRHGLQIERAGRRGLLLPQVAEENNLDAEKFLQHVCLKAGLPPTAWKEDDATVGTFEALHFGETLVVDPLAIDPPEARFSTEELAALVGYAATNVFTLTRGATPNYYAAGVPDGNVTGVALSLKMPGMDSRCELSRIELRGGVPLQSTLFEMCQHAAAAIHAGPAAPRSPETLDLQLAVLHDPAMHGTVAEPHTAGIDPARRAVLVVEQARSALVFDPDCTPETLAAEAAARAQVGSPPSAALYSLAADVTRAPFSVAQVPRPQAGPSVRPAAVAGRFYPAEAGELGRMVDEFLSGDAPPAERWPAVMVPHAGLVYSGRLAADVLRRVEIPDTVIVIGPKHTRLGVQWAVAPHETWSIPGATLASDVELARQLADKVPGLKLDAAAHLQEHAIEVELPLLARLNPRARVVGIALGAADLPQCLSLGSALAEALSDRRDRTLLVISSDMNHFATDAENRRLDEIALAALERLDPAHLFETVTANHISMCGVRPATVVLQTLRRWNTLTRCHRVGYSTTADVTGDPSRVVGYAGMLIG